MAAQATETANPRHVLFVTGPQRELLYEHFTVLFSGHDDVEVRIDRRHGERRRAARAPLDGELRRQERRRRSPDWVVPPLGTV
jgi:hypothetical protein